ncbi:MAG TPA: hypothetical protein VGB18_00925, partial [Candidatus Thermoplasmatota archaeon]
DYNVYRSGADDGLAGTTSDTSFVDSVSLPPVPFTIVAYTVTAVAEGVEGPPSLPAYVVLLSPMTAPDCLVIDDTTTPPGVGVDPDCLPPLP